jgi:ABC-type phosphate transport system substrate-binding protein
MTRIKSFFAAVVVTAIVALAPAANAQTLHVVGVGSSAQFLGTMIGESQLAANNLGGQCQYHWTLKNGLNAHDNRDSLNRILDETGSVGIVWLADCSDITGATNITHIWLDAQYDSTLGVRLFSAQQKSPTAGPGATVYLNGVTAGEASGNLVSPNNLWADNKADVAIPGALVTFLGTSSPGTYHVNMGLTDIRPEDALAATTRAKSALNTTTYSGLGYVGPTSQIGAPIYSSFSSANFTPIGFALSGSNDPINTGVPVPTYTTYPVGAAPIVFAYNNGGTYNSALANLVSGVKGDGTGNTAGSYKLANLFDGTTSCDSNNPAFGAGDGLATPITVLLREPLSGTMNTTEYTLFRTTGNTSDSQEKGVINPTRAPYNPLNLACTGNGSRRRGIGTGEITGNINSISNSIGYFFFSFANSAKVAGSASNPHYQYLTIDGADPIGLPTTNQELPYCSASLCPASQWAGGISFPSLRNGTYKAWSLYRWTIYDSNTDSLGPKALVASIQDNIDSTVADFVPFTTSNNSDGLEVYRSHFTQSAKTCSYTGTLAAQTCNGNQTPTELLTNGDSLGGGPEAGGDEGGSIIGWDHSTVKTANQTTGLCAGMTKVSKTAGRNFGLSATSAVHTGGNPAALEGLTVNINGSNYVVSSCIAPTATTLYIPGSLGVQSNLPFSVYIAPTACGTTGCDNGVIGKKQ